LKFVSTCFEHQKLSGYGAHGVNVLLGFERTPVDAYEIAHVRENFRFLFAACKRVNLFYFETNKFKIVQKRLFKKENLFRLERNVQLLHAVAHDAGQLF
jgi:hypothetical protein